MLLAVLLLTVWQDTACAEVDEGKITALAEQGNAEAQYNLAMMLFNGELVHFGIEEAVDWLRKAAEQGHAGAQYMMGNAYYFGYEPLLQDYQQAVVWYRKAAEQGDEDSQVSLGRMYAKGKGVSQDYQQAVVWYRKAADHCHYPAQSELGKLYAEGEGMPRDYQQAYAWYSVLAANMPDDAGTIAKRDDMAKKLTPAALAKAQALAGQYFEQCQPKS